jgi:acetyltransferase-like isoleucine patch superfamily enzyme
VVGFRLKRSIEKNQRAWSDQWLLNLNDILSIEMIRRFFISFFKKRVPLPAKGNYDVDEYTQNKITFTSNLEIHNSSVYSCKFGKYNKVNDSSYLYNVEYGDFTYSALRVTILNTKIGKYCSIAQGVSIGLGKHPVKEFVTTNPAFYYVHKQCGFTFTTCQMFDETGFVDIGNDVWIGANSIILDDVTIGDGAIIAANSVVTHDVPPYAIVGGSPAKVIKFRFSEEHIKTLVAFKWWNRDAEWIQTNHMSFLDLNKFIELIRLWQK